MQDLSISTQNSSGNISDPEIFNKQKKKIKNKRTAET